MKGLLVKQTSTEKSYAARKKSIKRSFGDIWVVRIFVDIATNFKEKNKES